MSTDLVVENGNVPIAVRDHGGAGTPVLLLHGAGGNLADWDLFAQRFTDRRAVAVDLRGHGESGDGPWETDAVCADLDAVVARLGLVAPAVVGVSLGGLVAVEWAARHTDCAAAVNLDGHPAVSRPGQCPGLAGDRAATLLAALRTRFDAMEAMLAAPLPADAVDAMLTARTAQARQFGLPVEPLLAATRRSLSIHGGQTFARPGASTLAAVRVALENADPFPAYRATSVPTLVAVATRDLPEQRDFAELTAAYRRHLTATLGAVTNPALRTVEIDASHAMLWERPDDTTTLITTFLTEHTPVL